jgi:hypothetical protein
LAYGPYLPLPAGDWCVTATLGFSPEVGRMPFIFEVDQGESLSRGFFEAEGAGFFRIKLSFGVKNPLQAIEMRLISQDSALEGDVSLVEVELTQSRH